MTSELSKESTKNKYSSVFLDSPSTDEFSSEENLTDLLKIKHSFNKVDIVNNYINQDPLELWKKYKSERNWEGLRKSKRGSEALSSLSDLSRILSETYKATAKNNFALDPNIKLTGFPSRFNLYCIDKAKALILLANIVALQQQNQESTFLAFLNMKVDPYFFDIIKRIRRNEFTVIKKEILDELRKSRIFGDDEDVNAEINFLQKNFFQPYPTSNGFYSTHINARYKKDTENTKQLQLLNLNMKRSLIPYETLRIPSSLNDLDIIFKRRYLAPKAPPALSYPINYDFKFESWKNLKNLTDIRSLVSIAQEIYDSTKVNMNNTTPVEFQENTQYMPLFPQFQHQPQPQFMQTQTPHTTANENQRQNSRNRRPPSSFEPEPSKFTKK